MKSGLTGQRCLYIVCTIGSVASEFAAVLPAVTPDLMRSHYLSPTRDLVGERDFYFYAYGDHRWRSGKALTAILAHTSTLYSKLPIEAAVDLIHLIQKGSYEDKRRVH